MKRESNTPLEISNTINAAGDQPAFPPLVHTDQTVPLELSDGHPDKPEHGSLDDIVNCVEEFVAKWRKLNG